MVLKKSINISFLILGLFLVSCQDNFFKEKNYEKSQLKNYYTGDVGHCNQFDGFYKGLVGSHFNKTGRNLDYKSSDDPIESRSKALLKFSKAPSLFKNVNNVYFFGWTLDPTIDSEGREKKHVDYNSVPISFDIKNIKTKKIITNPYNITKRKSFKSLNFKGIQPYLKDYLSPSLFFEDHVFILKQLNGFDGIVIYNYENGAISLNTKTLAYLPPIEPNPHAFLEKVDPLEFLKPLHPLVNYVDRKYSRQEYISYLHRICDKLHLE